jgi:hypothetical protein
MGTALIFLKYWNQCFPNNNVSYNLILKYMLLVLSKNKNNFLYYLLYSLLKEENLIKMGTLCKYYMNISHCTLENCMEDNL